MSRKALLPCAGLLTLLVAASASSQPDKSQPDKLPFGGAPPPEELNVLAPLIGQWTTKLEARPSLTDKEGYTTTGEITGQWLHNRHYLRVEGKSVSEKARGEFTVLYGYDAKKKAYRRWLFSSTGLTTEAEGQWDALKSTMTWKPVPAPQNTTGSVIEVLSKDRFETTVLFTRDDGKKVVDLTAIATRKK